MLKFIAFAVALACAGCGTAVNLVAPLQETRAYGGVRNDRDVIDKLFEGDASSLNPGDGVFTMIALALVALPFLDLPLSFVGDTLTLPYTRWLDRR